MEALDRYLGVMINTYRNFKEQGEHANISNITTYVGEPRQKLRAFMAYVVMCVLTDLYLGLYSEVSSIRFVLSLYQR